MAWSIVIISNLVARAVNKSPNKCCWRAHERGMAIIRKLILRMCVCNGAQRRVDHVAWKVLTPTQPNPTLSPVRVNKYPCAICITYQRVKCIYNDKDH